MDDATSGPAMARSRARTRCSRSWLRGVCGSEDAVVRSLQPGPARAEAALLLLVGAVAALALGAAAIVLPPFAAALAAAPAFLLGGGPEGDGVGGGGASADVTPSTEASLRAVAPS